VQKLLGEIRGIEARAKAEGPRLLSRDRITAAIKAMTDRTIESIYSVLTPGKHDLKKAKAIKKLLDDENFNRMLDAGGITFAMIKPYPHMAHPANHQRGECEVVDEIHGAIKSPLKIMVSADTHIPYAYSQQFYAHLADLGGSDEIYQRVTEFMSSGAVTGLILTDHNGNAIPEWRRQIGRTRPEEAAPDTLRHRFAVSVENNVLHGSDSIENVRNEVRTFSDWLLLMENG